MIQIKVSSIFNFFSSPSSWRLFICILKYDNVPFCDIIEWFEFGGEGEKFNWIQCENICGTMSKFQANCLATCSFYGRFFEISFSWKSTKFILTYCDNNFSMENFQGIKNLQLIAYIFFVVFDYISTVHLLSQFKSLSCDIKFSKSFFDLVIYIFYSLLLLLSMLMYIHIFLIKFSCVS